MMETYCVFLQDGCFITDYYRFFYRAHCASGEVKMPLETLGPRVDKTKVRINKNTKLSCRFVTWRECKPGPSTCPAHIHIYIHTLTCPLRVPYWWILAFIVRSRILRYGRSSTGHLSCYILSFKILLYMRATRITEELKEDIQTHSAVLSAVQRRVLVSHDGLNRVSELFPLCHV